MRSSSSFVFTFSAIILLSSLFNGPLVEGQRVEEVMSAYALLVPTIQYGAPLQISGWVRFDQISANNLSVQVTVYVNGLQPDGLYALHIHQYGDITDQQYASMVGGHFQGSSPTPTHGCPPNPARHEGDLGNWVSQGGIINQVQIMPFDAAALYLSGMTQSIVGLAVVLKNNADTCVPGYMDGSPLAQGVIGIMNIDNNFAEFEADVSTAVCLLFPTSLCPGCSGTVWFTQTPAAVTVTAMVQGLQMGSVHEINVHQFGDMSAPGETNMGAHYNPNGRPHQLPPTMPRHMGDLGNIQSYSASTGIAWYQYSTNNIPAIHEIIGRAVVIDSYADHGAGIGCDQDGAAGPGLLYGVIGVANPSNQPPPIPSDVIINNNWSDINCYATWGEASSGLKVAVVIGWILVVLLGGALAVIGFWYFKNFRKRSDYEELSERSVLRH